MHAVSVAFTIIEFGLQLIPLVYTTLEIPNGTYVASIRHTMCAYGC